MSKAQETTLRERWNKRRPLALISFVTLLLIIVFILVTVVFVDGAAENLAKVSAVIMTILTMLTSIVGSYIGFASLEHNKVEIK